MNAGNFFRNRKWFGYLKDSSVERKVMVIHRLHLEFPELLAAAEEEVRAFLHSSVLVPIL